MPMSYLCNTFFATDSMPHGLREVLSALPLSQTSGVVRGIATGEPVNVLTAVLILLAYLVVFTSIAFWFIYKKKNL